jgi:hypothetical protein
VSARSIFQDIPWFVIIFVVISVLRALSKARETKEQHEASQDETDEQRRVREIQERIRRIAAERGGRTTQTPAPAPAVLHSEPVPHREVEPPPAVSPLDPFGGPARRFVELLKEKKAALAEPPSLAPTRSAEVERQERLAAELQALEEKRALAQRRVAELAVAQTAQMNSEEALRAATRDQVLVDLRDPQSVRRAFLLREILGTPVGLR